MSLTKLKGAIDEALEPYEVVVIRLTPAMEKAATGEKMRFVTSFFGIPVFVDSAVPADEMWVLKKREIKV